MLSQQVITIALQSSMDSVTGLALTPYERTKTAVMMLLELSGMPVPQCYPKPQNAIHQYSLELVFSNVKRSIQTNLGYWLQDRSAHVIPISYVNDILTVHVYDSLELNPIRQQLRRVSSQDLELVIAYLEKAATTSVFDSIAVMRPNGLLDYRTLLYGA